jgi:hypothetical protein
MPQLIAIVLAGAGLYAGVKWLAKEAHRTWALAGREQPSGTSGAADDLDEALLFERDPSTGVYRLSPSREPGEAA